MMLYSTIQGGRTGYVFSLNEGKAYFIPATELQALLCAHIRKKKRERKKNE